MRVRTSLDPPFLKGLNMKDSNQLSIEDAARQMYNSLFKYGSPVMEGKSTNNEVNTAAKDPNHKRISFNETLKKIKTRIESEFRF